MAFSSMYIGSTGLVAHGQKMDVVGNNLANVSTIGYKESRALFSDLISKSVPGATGQPAQTGTMGIPSQVGQGVRISDIQSVFREGAFMEGTTNTDLAIGGKGFFQVYNDSKNTYHYTRAGNFRFDKDGMLTSMHGYNVQGYKYDPDTGSYAATTSSIQLPYEETTIDGQKVKLFQSSPKATSTIDLSVNLDAERLSASNDPANPFFAMVSNYNATSTPPVDPLGSTFTTSMKIYDEEGGAHTVSVSFDPVPLSNASGGQRVWEYMVTVPTGEDARTNAMNTSAAGLLMFGTLRYNADGQLINQSAYTLSSGASMDTKNAMNLSNWTVAAMNSTGSPVFNASFLNASNAATKTQSVTVDFGLTSSNATWTNATPGVTNAASVGSNAANLAIMGNINRDASASTSFAQQSATMSQAQDGYGVGSLMDVSVGLDGAINAHYSNGQDQIVAKVGLYNFTNEFGLRREGGNMFGATTSSGAAIAGKAGEDGMGSVVQDTLESSNVDMTTQFTEMILTQRGFQANSKVISTSDAMLSTISGLKR